METDKHDLDMFEARLKRGNSLTIAEQFKLIQDFRKLLNQLDDQEFSGLLVPEEK